MAEGLEHTPIPSRLPRWVTWLTAILGLSSPAWIWLWALHQGLWPLAGTACLITVAIGLYALWFAGKILTRRATPWLGSYLFDPAPRIHRDRPLDICFVFVDRFVPAGDPAAQLEAVRNWQKAYGDLLEGHADSRGRCPKHTWFIEPSQLGPEAREQMAHWPERSWGEIEFLFDPSKQGGAEELRESIGREAELLREMGACPQGRFVAARGGAALTGGLQAEEVAELLHAGCQADLSFPALGSPAQPANVNRILDLHTHSGEVVFDVARADNSPPAESLLLLPGPTHIGLTLGVFDGGTIGPGDPPYIWRIYHWLAAHVHLPGRPNWVFFVIHGSTASDPSRRMLLGKPLDRLWTAMEERFKSPGHRLHYVTAREAVNIARAAQAGRDGNPSDYRDFRTPPPEVLQ